MAVTTSASTLISDALRDLAVALDAAKHGEKSALKNDFCDHWGWNTHKLHRELKNIGWSSGRKRRCDAGTTSQDEKVLNELAAMVKLGVRKNGKATMQIPNARSILSANGRNITVSNGRLNTLLRQRSLDLASQSKATPHLNMRSLHPNHVHLVDPSLCLLYYAPNGKQHVMHDDEIYKNKPDWVEKVGNLKCWRYVLVDHYSNTIMVRYFQAKGESTTILYEFLLWCWSKHTNRPFNGIPKLMVWDKGSANSSSAIKLALGALDVEDYAHMAGNPRAKGAVEECNNRVEKLFESRLKYEPVSSVEELNAAAEKWMNAYNANAIPDYDASLKRPGMKKGVSRYALWQTIRQDQLRILPDCEVCKYLLSAEPQSRVVKADLSVSFRHPVAKKSLSYSLRGIPNVVPRGDVMVSPLIYGDHLVKVHVTDYKGDEEIHIVEPLAFDETSGQRMDGVVWGAGFDAQPDTIIDNAGKQADKAAFPDKSQEGIKKAIKKNEKPFGGLNAHSHLGDVYHPDYIDKRGTKLDVPDHFSLDKKPLSIIQASRTLVAILSRSLTAEESEWIRDNYSNGVFEDDLPEIVEYFNKPRVGLAVVK